MRQKNMIGYGILLGLIVLVLHMTVQRQGFSLFPLPIVAGTLLVYLLDRPVGWLMVLAVFFELLSTAPIGVVTAVLLAPWVIRRVFSSVEIDISFSFLLLLGFTVFIQTTLLAASAALPVFREGFAWAEIYRYFPVLPWILTLTGSTVALFVLTIAWYEINPRSAYGS